MPGLRAAARPLIAAVRTALFLPPVRATQPKPTAFDIGAQLFQMVQHVSGCLARKYDGEFLSPAAVGLSSARDPRQPCRDHAQHLISGVMAVSVVAALEVVDVEHRDGI